MAKEKKTKPKKAKKAEKPDETPQPQGGAAVFLGHILLVCCCDVQHSSKNCRAQNRALPDLSTGQGEHEAIIPYLPPYSKKREKLV